jgi:ElaB/YqjD/DUF883 family membrane-anchored ribosome-binding protein
MAQSSGYSTRESGSRPSTVDSLKDKAQEQVENVATQLEGAAKAIADQGREVGDNVQVVAGNMRSAVEKSVRDQPITTLALTAAVAFVVGALWKS